MDYRLDDLGPNQFESLVQALLLKLYGPVLEVAGPGRDGGRDAALPGRAMAGHVLPAREPGSGWHGYHVFQVKFRLGPLGSNPDLVWMKAQVRKELSKWTSTRRQDWQPEYIVFITNIQLSSDVGGGRDQIADLIQEHAADNRWPLKACAVWDRTKVSRLLDTAPEIRWSFNGLITPGDVLAAVTSMTDQSLKMDLLEPALFEHARGEILDMHNVNTHEAGAAVNRRLDVLAHDVGDAGG